MLTDEQLDQIREVLDPKERPPEGTGYLHAMVNPRARLWLAAAKALLVEVEEQRSQSLARRELP